MNQLEIINLYKKQSFLREKNNRFVYVFFNELTFLCKIGITDNVSKRQRDLINSSGCNINKVIVIQLQNDFDENAFEIERFLHSFFKQKRKLGEWFSLNIRDLAAIRILFYLIEGEEIEDNLKSYLPMKAKLSTL